MTPNIKTPSVQKFRSATHRSRSFDRREKRFCDSATPLRGMAIFYGGMHPESIGWTVARTNQRSTGGEGPIPDGP